MAETTRFYEHPQYTLLNPSWQRYSDFDVGEHNTLVQPRYLWLHEFEIASSDESFQVKGGSHIRAIREQRTQYVNRIAPILGRYVSMLFQNELDLEPLGSLFTPEELADVDGEGTSFEDWLKKAARLYFRDGKVLGLVDSYAIDARSRGDEAALGARPFLCLLDAMSVPDWARETGDPARRGRYNWLRWEYDLIEPREQATDTPVKNRYTRVLSCASGRYSVRTYRASGQSQIGLQGQASGAWIEVNEEVYPEPPLTELPIAVLDDLSWLRDVISVTLLRHNTQSSVDNGLLFQAHQRIVAAGKFDPDEALVMQEGVVTILPPDTSVTVIEPSDPVALERRLKELDLEILQTAFYKDRYIPIDSRAVQSAESQIEEDVDYVTNMTRAGRRLEGFANELVRQWAAFKGQDWDNELKLNLDLTKEDFDAHVRVLATLWDTISQYERWKKEELKKVAANRNLNNVDEILEEIESGPDEAAIERQEAQRMQRWDNMRTQLLGKRNGAAAVEKDE